MDKSNREDTASPEKVCGKKQESGSAKTEHFSERSKEKSKRGLDSTSASAAPWKDQDRYSRQIIMPEIGKEGQDKLQRSKVAVIGLGALGSLSAELLSRAGVGSLLIIDRDFVEISNLQRQLLYDEQDIGKLKAEAAKEKLAKINSSIDIVALPIHLNKNNLKFLDDCNLILDCTDNLKTRFLINDYCRKNNKPWIYAAAIRTKGYVMPIIAEEKSPCLRCFIKDTADNLETCSTSGVINALTASVSSWQSSLAFKILLGKQVQSELYHFDCWNLECKKINIKKNKDCPVCQGQYEFLEKDEGLSVLKFCGTERFQIQGHFDYDLLKEKLAKIENIEDFGSYFSFRNLLVFKDQRILIAADSKNMALADYSCWVGD